VERHYLVVAADGNVREALAAPLREQGMTVTFAESGSQAERAVQSVKVDVAIVESHLRDMSVEELTRRLGEIRPDCEVVPLTSFQLIRNTPELLRFGVGDYVLSSRQLPGLMRPPTEEPASGSGWEEPSTQALIGVIDVVVGLLELQTERFSSSSHAAMGLARDTAMELESGEEMLFEVVLGALLRDIGRTGLEPAAEIDAKGEGGQGDSSLRLLEHIDFPWKVMPVVRHHQEWYNGSGAPDGLCGREIPMAARIIAVVDRYVRLTADDNDEASSPNDALEDIARETGHRFDPEVVEAFLRVMDRRLAGRKPTGKPQVVLVDRDPKFRRVLKVRLGNAGLKVLETKDYGKCIQRLLKEPPDLAVVSIDGDPKEAFQLLQEIQQDDSLCRIPVAFLSSRSDRVQKIRALRQGVDDFLCKGDNMEELVARIENILVRGAIRAEGDARRKRRGVTGTLDNLGLPDLVQTLSNGMKTACVTLTAGSGRNGSIWFQNGTPKHAECGTLDGEKAFYEMVRWTTGEFVIEHGVESQRQTIERDAMFLLMEGLRLVDEGEEIA
jgi:response regulator RpfG family c-di-GMP phosphodiesterase